MKIKAYISSFLLLCSVIACQNNKSEIDPNLHESILLDRAWEDSLFEMISLDELPPTVREGIRQEKIFDGLDISNITRITRNDLTYYDMTFRDFDGQLIMVFYDDKGEIYVP